MALAGDRRAARQLALDVLYQAEIRDQLPMETLALREEQDWSPSDSGDAPSEEAITYARVLISGVEQHCAGIDQRISTCADHWTLDRMPIVDRNLLRVASFELLWRPEVPVAVVINEAIELAKSISTEDSGRFINGILGRIAGNERLQSE